MEAIDEYARFKQIREELGQTQSEFAKNLNIKKSTADIERGRTRIPGSVVAQLLAKYDVNPLWLYGLSNKKHLDPHQAQAAPSVVAVDSEGRENILLVNQKASAGYGTNLRNQEFIQTLPAFDFPLPEFRNASFRGFQISGDSMLPLVRSGDWVLAKALNRIEEVKDNRIYIIVDQESVRLKQIKLHPRFLELISLNPEYNPVQVLLENVQEIWEYHSKISFGVDRIQGLTLHNIYNEIKDLKKAILR